MKIEDQILELRDISDEFRLKINGVEFMPSYYELKNSADTGLTELTLKMVFMNEKSIIEIER